jgi:uncharacterized SAM-dependent methyltransferase
MGNEPGFAAGGRGYDRVVMLASGGPVTDAAPVASEAAPRLARGDVHLMVRPATAFAGEVRRALRERTILPAHLFYETPGGAANWTALTADATYASAGDSAELLRRESDAIGRAVAGLTDGKPIRVVSLGPGDGWKDELVMAAIAGTSMHYYALDTSAILATQAMTRALTSERLPGARASALVARFDDLPALRPIYERDGAVNLIMMLGNTLGNLSDEVGLVRLLGDRAMKADDLLLLEVTLQKPGTDEIASLGDQLSIRRFNFEPLAALGLQLAPERMTYALAGDRSTIPGTVSIVASYGDFVVDGEHIGRADLAYVHRYVAEAIPGMLAAAGLDVCRPPWFGPARRSMLVLARRRG